jgi:hypothetical protein
VAASQPAAPSQDSQKEKNLLLGIELNPVALSWPQVKPWHPFQDGQKKNKLLLGIDLDSLTS